jgi:hypothetical protein
MVWSLVGLHAEIAQSVVGKFWRKKNGGATCDALGEQAFITVLKARYRMQIVPA